MAIAFNQAVTAAGRVASGALAMLTTQTINTTDTIVLFVAADNKSGRAESDFAPTDDTSGKITWGQPIISGPFAATTANTTVRNAIIIGKVNSTISSGATITLPANSLKQTAQAVTYTGVLDDDPDKKYRNAYTTAAAAASSISCTKTALNGEMLLYGCGFEDGGAGFTEDTDTTNGTWTNRADLQDSATDATGCSGYFGDKLVSANGDQTWNPSAMPATGSGSGDWSVVLVSLRPAVEASVQISNPVHAPAASTTLLGTDSLAFATHYGLRAGEVVAVPFVVDSDADAAQISSYFNVSDGSGNITWSISLVGSVVSQTSKASVRTVLAIGVVTAYVPIGTTITITGTPSGGLIAASPVAFTGVNTASPLGTTATANGTSTTPSTTNAGGSANAGLIAAIGIENSTDKFGADDSDTTDGPWVYTYRVDGVTVASKQGGSSGGTGTVSITVGAKALTGATSQSFNNTITSADWSSLSAILNPAPTTIDVAAPTATATAQAEAPAYGLGTTVSVPGAATATATAQTPGTTITFRPPAATATAGAEADPEPKFSSGQTTGQIWPPGAPE